MIHALQEKLEQMNPEKRPEQRWARMEEDLKKTLAALLERAKDPGTPPADRRKLEQMARDLQRTLNEMSKEPNPEKRWKLMTELEKSKAILKSVARGERIQDEQWNKLLSTLDDGLWQVGGRSLPEEYRKSIEQYQERIRRLTGDGEDDRR